ncbi:MAG: hypothetical protein GYA21_18335 [Myxococcales bacterium]|nr:hypothetical protein [Myxococcales bacterium]
MTRRTLFRALFVLGAALLSGCAAAHEQTPSDLRSVVNLFHRNVRWQYSDLAAAVVRPDCRKAFLDLIEDAKDDLHITNYELRSVTPQPGTPRASVRIHMSFYRLPSTVIQNETVEQVWEQQERNWILVSQTGGPFPFPPPGCDEPPPASPSPANDAPPDPKNPGR